MRDVAEAIAMGAALAWCAGTLIALASVWVVYRVRLEGDRAAYRAARREARRRRLGRR